MEIDIANISDLLREVIEFLESLRDVQLSLALENLREKLLTRSKDTLSLTTMPPQGSPEPYLDMNSGPKSLLLRKSETDTEEYVGMEGSKRQSHHQDYYETFENEGQSVANERSEQNDDETEEGQTLIRIYKKLSAAQIRSKCHKYGPLFKKEERKLFLSESRACWVALVGSHLLVYRNERHNQPYAIYPIRGYMARPAPNLIRDRQKSESAFEIYRPGNETLGFIARTPKDMEQWIAKICEVGGRPFAKNAKVKVEGRGKKRRTNPVIESSIPDRDAKDSTLDDLDSPTVKDESTIKDEEMREKKDPGGNPPPLPARIPRRLPSLPPDDAIPTYKAIVEDDDDEDDIYHKIEDLKNGTRYQNMMLSRKQRADKKREIVVAYDDVRASEESKNEGQTREEGDATPSEETYDDIALSRINATVNSELQNHDSHPDGEEKREEFYDDVENLLSNGKLTKDRAKDQSKSPQKKSFLDRVLSRKESPGKSEKRYKGKIPSSSTKEETSIYDDASDVTMNHESVAVEGPEELPEYNCPPPPRPIYTKSTTLNGQVDQVEEFYDDVTACREQYKNQMQTSLQESDVLKAKETPGNATTRQEANDDDLPQGEIEHYQSPRSDLCVRNHAENHQQNEEVLYDDIALLVDFTARQRDINGKRDANEDATIRSTISPDKRSWNRKFVAINRKSRGIDSETNRRGGANECEEIDIDSSEGNGATKRNTFQKLISRMENSLAKVSSRGNPSFPPTGK